MIRTYILQFDPQKKQFKAKQGGACPRELVDEATFVEAANEIVLDLKTLYGAIVTEPLAEFDHMTELHDAEHAAMLPVQEKLVVTISPQDGGAALPIPEPAPLADAVGIQVTPDEGGGAAHTGSEIQMIERNEDTEPEPEVAPVETQPVEQPAPVIEPEQPTTSPVTEPEPELAVAGIA